MRTETPSLSNFSTAHLSGRLPALEGTSALRSRIRAQRRDAQLVSARKTPSPQANGLQHESPRRLQNTTDQQCTMKLSDIKMGQRKDRHLFRPIVRASR